MEQQFFFRDLYSSPQEQCKNSVRPNGIKVGYEEILEITIIDEISTALRPD